MKNNCSKNGTKAQQTRVVKTNDIIKPLLSLTQNVTQTNSKGVEVQHDTRNRLWVSVSFKINSIDYAVKREKLAANIPIQIPQYHVTLMEVNCQCEKEMVLYVMNTSLSLPQLQNFKNKIRW